MGTPTAKADERPRAAAPSADQSPPWFGTKFALYLCMAKKKQIRPRQQRGMQTYNTLITSALSLLAKNDLGQLRFAQLSKASKVPQSLIDYHFPSLEALHMAMIQYKMGQLFTLTIETLEKFKNNPRKSLEAYIKLPFQFAQSDEEFLAIWTAFYHLITVNSSIAHFNSTVQKNGHDRIMNIIRSILVEEKLKLLDSESLEDLAHQFHGTIIGYLMMASTHSQKNFTKWQKLALQNIFKNIATATTPH